MDLLVEENKACGWALPLPLVFPGSAHHTCKEGHLLTLQLQLK